MSELNMDYDEITNFAYKVAIEFVHDEDLAKEIAQVAAIECYLNQDNLREESLNSWLYAVAKNKAISMLKKRRTEFKKITDLYDKALVDRFAKYEQLDASKPLEEFFLEEKEFHESPDSLNELLNNIPKRVIPLKHRDLLFKIIRSNYDYKRLSKSMGLSVSNLRKKFYRIKKTIYLYHKINNGTKRLHPIPGTKLNRNILNLVKRLKHNIQNNDFSIFDEFDLDAEITNFLKTRCIKDVFDYRVDIENENEYRLMLAYMDNNDEVCSVKFLIKNINSKIKICSSPIKPKKILKITNTEVPENILMKLGHKKDGTPILSKEELDKLLKQCDKGVEEIYNSGDSI